MLSYSIQRNGSWLGPIGQDCNTNNKRDNNNSVTCKWLLEVLRTQEPLSPQQVNWPSFSSALKDLGASFALGEGQAIARWHCSEELTALGATRASSPRPGLLNGCRCASSPGGKRDSGLLSAPIPLACHSGAFWSGISGPLNERSLWSGNERVTVLNCTILGLRSRIRHLVQCLKPAVAV